MVIHRDKNAKVLWGGRICFIIIVSVILWGGCFPALAQLTNVVESKTFDQFFERMLKIVEVIGTVVVAFFIIWAGFLFVSARGSEEQVTKAKSVFIWTVVGAAILMGASVIARAVINFF